jgi:hypothetical protein
MSTTSVSTILEAIKILDENHYRWVLEQIRKGEEEAEAAEDDCE